MILRQLRLLGLEHCDIWVLEISETPTLCIETGQMSLLATEDTCPASAADILSQQQTSVLLPAAGVSSVETG